MNDRTDDLLVADGERWRSGLDLDPDLASLLNAGATRRGVRPLMVAAAAVVVLVVALGALVINTERGRHETRPLSAGSAAPSSNAPTGAAGAVSCTNGGLRAPSLATTAATRAQLHTFAAVAAIACSFGQRRYSDGVWLVVRQQSTNSGIPPLVAALDQPDTTSTAKPSCLDYADISPQLVLVDASGKLLRPRYPRDGCGHVQAAAKAATARLHWTTTSTIKISLAGSPPTNAPSASSLSDAPSGETLPSCTVTDRGFSMKSLPPGATPEHSRSEARAVVDSGHVGPDAVTTVIAAVVSDPTGIKLGLPTTERVMWVVYGRNIAHVRSGNVPGLPGSTASSSGALAGHSLTLVDDATLRLGGSFSCLR